MTSCAALRIGAAAIVAYSIGAMAGSAMAAWVLAGLAAVGMVVWSRLAARRSGGACGIGCAPQPADVAPPERRSLVDPT